jgi:hypothetical protein
MLVPSLSGTPTGGDTWRMQQFSLSYALAVASAAGCSLDWVSVDIDSTDATLRWKTAGTAVRSPQLDVQLKATYKNCIGDKTVAFSLKRKNYDELRYTDLAVPRILVVVVVPSTFEEWAAHTEDQLALRRCGYWLSLHGLPDVTTDTKTVHLPRAQVFDPPALHGVFTRIAAKQLP